MTLHQWSVEFENGGYVMWETVAAASADEARGMVGRVYANARVRAVSRVS